MEATGELWARIRDYYAEHKCALICVSQSGGRVTIAIYARGELPPIPPFLTGETTVEAYKPGTIRLWSET